MVFSEYYPDGDRAQTHSLEAVVVIGLMVLTLIFSIQATAITPLTISTSNQHIETQQQRMADGLLSGTAENSDLEGALLDYDTTEQEFVGATPDGFIGEFPDNKFGNELQETFGERGIAVNVEITYEREQGDSRTFEYIRQGEPSQNSVSATKTVVLYDDMQLTAGNNQEIGETSSYIIPDAYPDSPVYNVVVVRLNLWRI